MREIQHTEAGGYSFACKPAIPFEQWIETRQGMDKFSALSRKDKEKIFLRWKWGFTDENINSALEISNKADLKMVFDNQDTGEVLERMNEGWKFHFQHKLQFEETCEETKLRIGLKDSPLIDHLKDIFEVEK